MSVVDVDSGVSDKAYPEVFDIRAMLPQSKQKKPGQLPDDMIRKYFEDVSNALYICLMSLTTANKISIRQRET